MEEEHWNRADKWPFHVQSRPQSGANMGLNFLQMRLNTLKSSEFLGAKHWHQENHSHPEHRVD